MGGTGTYKKIGYRTKFNEVRRKLIYKALSRGATRSQAAKFAKIQPATLYEWMGKGANEEEGPFRDFVVQIEKAETDFLLKRLDRIDKAGKTGKWQADAWTLERLKPELYGRRDRIEQVNYNLDLTQLSDEQLDRLEKGEDVRSVVGYEIESGEGASPKALGEGSPEVSEG